MSFKQQFEWRLHVTSRPKLIVTSGPVVVAHSLPAGFKSVQESYSLHCLRARAPIIDQLPVVFAHSSSVPGRLNRFVRSSSRVKCVGLALFMIMQLLQA